jgi:SAM-dependent methyltransferase
MTETFNALYASVYDVIYAGKDYDREVAIVEAALRRFAKQPVATLLDIGCGSGEHTRRLAAKGLKVTGVDRSPHMLERATTKAKESPHGSSQTFVEGDARSFNLNASFDTAIMMFAVLSYQTTNQDLAKALSVARRHLKSGALFLFDAWYGPAVLVHPPGGKLLELDTPDGKILRATSTTLSVPKHQAGIRFKVWQIQNDKAVAESDETHELRYFFPQELAYFLEVAGFKLLHLGAFPEWEREPGLNDWNFFAVAEAV